MFQLQQTFCLKISKIDDNTFKILTGVPKEFVTDQTIIIRKDNPNILWNLLYELSGIPMPVHIDPKKVISDFLEQESRKRPKISEPSIEKQKKMTAELTPLEKEFSTMSASDIVSKVFNEKGIQITNSLKSKAAIINKAKKIYENK